MTVLMTGYAETGLLHPQMIRRRKSDGAFWNGAAFEAYNASNIATYGIAAAETGVTGVYTATDPADTVAGDFLLIAAAGASLVVSDVATNLRWQDAAGTTGLTQADVREAIGMADDDLDDQLAAINVSIASISSSGSGAWLVTVTVNDGSAPLQGALVRFTMGAESSSARTNSSGVATFGLDTGTWTVVITLSGQDFAPTTLAVSGNTPVTYSMTPRTLLPSTVPDTVTGYLIVLDEFDVPTSSVTVWCRTISVIGNGLSPSKTFRPSVSAGSGLVQFTNLFPGARYELKRGSTTTVIEIPSDAVDSVELPSMRPG